MSSAFDKLKQIEHKPVPLQTTEPIKARKREQETSYTVWLDKKLMKALKLKALEQEVSVKEILDRALRVYLAS